MKPRTALVLSGGGMFGAWHAGAWETLSAVFQPDLIVGASVGSLVGYAIAGGATPAQLRDLWMQPSIGQLARLPETIRDLMSRFPPRRDFALVATDLLRMKPKTFHGAEITAEHLAASCGLIPGILSPQRIDGRLYGDGGLLNPLPVWAAVELGATRIVGLNVLAQIPFSIVKPAILAMRWLNGYNPPVPSGVQVTVLSPPRPLGTAFEAVRWNARNVARWLEQGRTDASDQLGRLRGEGNISIENCLER